MANGQSRARKAVPSVRAGVLTGFWAFVLAIFVSLPLQRVLSHLPPALSILTILLVVATGVLFDVVGLAAASADEAPFHAMAAKKIPGARQSITIVRNAGKVVTICNDVVGDLAGTLSGALAAGAVFQVSSSRGWNPALAGTLAVGLVAALTVGGKASAKRVAIGRSDEITTAVGRLLYGWEQVTGIKPFGGNSSGRRTP